MPELWLLAGNKWDYLMKPWLEKLESFGDQFEIRMLHRVEKIRMNEAGTRIAGMEFVRPDCSPSVNDDWEPLGKPFYIDMEDSSVIMAVTPGALTNLLVDEFYDAAPELGKIRYLYSKPMGALQLYLNRKLPDVTKNVTDFQGALYYMTFLDYTQLWPDVQNTFM